MQVFASGQTFFILFISWTAANMVTVFASELPALVRVGYAMVVLVVAASITAFVQAVRAPRPYANFDTSEFRFGKRTVPMAEIESAQLFVFETKRKRAVSLILGAGRKRQAAFLLRASNGTPLDEGTRLLLAEVLRRSAVGMPSAPEDPKGKFARFNFPTHITKDEAIAVALNPPEFGDELPIPPQR